MWAVSPQLILMSCNLEQQEAMPAQGNCCCSVHSLTNRGGGSRSLRAHFQRTKEVEGDGVRNNLSWESQVSCGMFGLEGEQAGQVVGS